MSAMTMVFRTHRKAKQRGFVEIKNATFCYLTAMIAHLGAITFLSNAYEFYLPAMVGLAISMTFAANRLMDQSGNPVVRSQQIPQMLRTAW
jgi:hypothetical protein